MYSSSAGQHTVLYCTIHCTVHCCQHLKDKKSHIPCLSQATALPTQSIKIKVCIQQKMTKYKEYFHHLAAIIPLLRISHPINVLIHTNTSLGVCVSL